LAFSAESEPAQSTCSAMKALMPSPDPGEEYSILVPAHCSVYIAIIFCIADFWADDPEPTSSPPGQASEVSCWPVGSVGPGPSSPGVTAVPDWQAVRPRVPSAATAANFTRRFIDTMPSSSG